MTEKVLEYRKNHKRCKYCEHLQIVLRRDGQGGSYYHCKAKQVIIKDMFPDMIRFPRLFCQCYEVKEDD